MIDEYYEDSSPIFRATSTERSANGDQTHDPQVGFIKHCPAVPQFDEQADRHADCVSDIRILTKKPVGTQCELMFWGADPKTFLSAQPEVGNNSLALELVAIHHFPVLYC